MGIALLQPVSARWLGGQLDLEVAGADREVRALCGLGDLAEGGLSFALPGRDLGRATAGVALALAGVPGGGVTVIVSENPRLDFIRAQYLLQAACGFEQPSFAAQVHPSVTLGPGAVIESGVVVGEGCTIGANAVLTRGTRIGRHTEIQCGAVVGDAGFGFERDPGHLPLRMLHLGGVLIGDHVEIGANTCIARGALGDTVLEDHVKINNLVHIAHNCRIGAGTLIGACADLCGSISVGRNCWIAPNVSIRQKLVIGEEAIVGMGAVVVKDVPAGVTVCGNPARRHRDGEQARRLRGYRATGKPKAVSRAVRL